MTQNRCMWCGNDALYVRYHDQEWGVPVHDDRHLFEMLILEGAQAGLSWMTILRKRENYRKAFADFDVGRIAEFSSTDMRRLLDDAGIVRNRLKIEATVANARMTLDIRREFGSLDEFLWRFVDYKPRQNAWPTLNEVPSHTEQSDLMSKELKKRGFKFVGSTICYAFMQAVGMVNDHTLECFRHAEVKKLGLVQRHGPVYPL
jgi:DNA-3-methyladenine glycosylase I